MIFEEFDRSEFEDSDAHSTHIFFMVGFDYEKMIFEIVSNS